MSDTTGKWRSLSGVLSERIILAGGNAPKERERQRNGWKETVRAWYKLSVFGRMGLNATRVCDGDFYGYLKDAISG